MSSSSSGSSSSAPASGIDTGNDTGIAGIAGDLTARVRRRLPGSDLRARVERLEAEVAESRGLSLRIAELTDLVAELVVPLAESDPGRARAIAARVRGGLGG